MAQPCEQPAFGQELARLQKCPSSELSAQSMLPSQNLEMGRQVALSRQGNSLRRQVTAPWHIDASSSELSPEPQSASPSHIHLNIQHTIQLRTYKPYSYTHTGCPMWSRTWVRLAWNLSVPVSCQVAQLLLPNFHQFVGKIWKTVEHYNSMSSNLMCMTK